MQDFIAHWFNEVPARFAETVVVNDCPCVTGNLMFCNMLELDFSSYKLRLAQSVPTLVRKLYCISLFVEDKSSRI